MKNLELSSGLKCYIMKKNGFLESRAYLCVNFGARDLRFSRNAEIFTLPCGTAHFLEHKMFDGNYPAKFAELAAECNAFTSFDSTVYHFGCGENFYEALKILLEMVEKCRFNAQSVESEKDIICQEINMYEDNLSLQAYFLALKAMYHNDFVRLPILGTQETIGKITAETLQLAHNFFYLPQNMSLFCIGDVNEEKIIDIASSFFLSKKSVLPHVLSEQEGVSVNLPKTDKNLNAKIPIVCIGFKCNSSFDDLCKRDAIGALLADILFGEAGDLRQILLSEKISDNSAAGSYFGGRGYAHTVFEDSTEKFDKMFEITVDYATKLAKIGVDATEFERVKNKLAGNIVRLRDDFDSMGVFFADCCAKGYSPLEFAEKLDKLTLDDLNSNFLSYLDTKNVVIATVK